MQNSSDTGARRPVILYIIIAIALFAALLLTVRWAKSRADFYGQQQAGQGQTATTTEESQPQGSSDESSPAETSSPQQTQAETSTPQPQQTQASQSSESTPSSTHTPSTVASTGPPVVHSVPATGPEQLVLPIVSVSAFVFAALSYVRARRRYAAESLAK
jgi:FtsZ-interacting cell division protein ZipA